MFPSNINNAIKKSTGEVIKILCQDDFLFDFYRASIQLSIAKDK
jgi:hypothetical protein